MVDIHPGRFYTKEWQFLAVYDMRQARLPSWPSGRLSGSEKKTAARFRHEAAYSVGEGGVTARSPLIVSKNSEMVGRQRIRFFGQAVADRRAFFICLDFYIMIIIPTGKMNL